MAKSVLAELVTKMTVESSQFKKELERTTAKTAAFGKAQTKAANDATFSSKKMSNAFRQAANSASTLQGPMGGVASRLSTVASGFASVGVAAASVGLAITAMAAVTGLSVAQFGRMEQRLLRTEALFKATSGAAGLTTSELKGLADEVAENTLASVDGVTKAINVLQTFKSISGETFERTISLSQDLAAVMGTDIKSASLQLGKALEDPILGLTSLRRAGVSFSETQKEVIRNLVATGQAATAQKLILDSLESQVGGAGSAEGAGLSGAVDLLGQRWDEMLESFANTTMVGQAATSSINMLAGAIDSISNAIGGNDDIEDYKNQIKELQAEILKANNTGRGIGANASRREEIEEIQATIDKLEEKQAKEQAIIEKGRILRLQAAEEKKQAEIRKQEEIGLASLSAIEKSLASEEELYMMQWKDRNKKIEDLVLSEEEIRARGFENLLDLQRDYIDKSSALTADKIFNAQEKERSAQKRQVDMEVATNQKMQGILLSNGQAIASTIAGIAKEGSAAQKVAFFAQQAIAIASTIINAEMAAIAALAPPPVGLGPVAGLPYSQTIRGMGYISAGLIGAQTIAGARELGGHVSGGKTYLVGEKGPELFTAGASGQITSNDNLQQAMGSSSGNITMNISIQSRRPGDIMAELNSVKKPLTRMMSSLKGAPV